ncbi:NAD(P)-dependent alcohol dehydrogenase [Campylobacter sp. MIT 21-1685]|uniref:NAD(P)-dependent alcohol dehydrogenase n=1 Tax=unclassified Campylobacter TaxID=2593542 RepID=UPI00224B9A3D|nr:MULTISPECIES: NAD(P)-dependent alcohol dehydrogenase [unclassified Campylobacter]MCX2683792.1 NAD(P)-dependent alcohol dehydrogenase [Campylobacter sp. MIT 21-1684]MCX2752075.1 NAD(P)-dependent alcohol dehydrogenase [Campylobacter sp. MIT 21-1682]MCX2808268.1 NAD(P)-dependent alcohol dehydrogenase [Campylobacter sp. MIT 21-1685]
MNKRRIFLKNSAKFTGALATVGFASSLFAQTPSNQSVKSASFFKEGEPIPSLGYAAHSKEWKFKPFSFTRHPLGENDVLIKILYAGICHSDLHAVRGEHGKANYPMVPGHEIAGTVVAIGKKVRKFRVGDFAGVGCMVNSCGVCEACKESREQYCVNAKTVFTYNSKDVFHNGEITYGGYSNNIVVNENFVIKVPKNAQIEKLAPLLCAGITTYSPIRFSKVAKGDKVAVTGVGGLGHMALQYLVALGAEVTCFDILDKSKAVMALGAKKFVNVASEEFKNIRNEFSFIISTIPYHYNIQDYHRMLRFGGEMAIVGLPSPQEAPSIDSQSFIWNFQNKRIYPSLIGGIKETQEMLEYSVKNKIYPKVQIIPIQSLDEAYKKVARGEADFRFVIDMSTLADS